jgi:hypothetical protein
VRVLEDELKVFNEADSKTPEVATLPKDALVFRLAEMDNFELVEFPSGTASSRRAGSRRSRSQPPPRRWRAKPSSRPEGRESEDGRWGAFCFRSASGSASAFRVRVRGSEASASTPPRAAAAPEADC